MGNFFKKHVNVSDRELIFLSWPIFVELFLRVIVGNVNVYMISNYSEPAVAAVSASNQLLNLTVFIYGFITVGTQIIISQLIGANQRKRIPPIVTTALFGSLAIGLMVSLAFLFFPDTFLRWMNLDDNLVQLGRDYLQIYGGSLVVSALTAVIIAVLRTHSFTRPALLVPTVSMILAIIGNYLALYSPFGLPNLGVAGLAWSSAIANTIGLVIACKLLNKHVGFSVLKVRPKQFSFTDIKKILTLGLPSSGESLSYQAAQVVVTMIVASLGSSVLIAKSYVQTITQFVYLIANALAQGNQIMIGRNVGGRQFDRAYTRGRRTVVLGMCASTIVCLLTWVFIEPIMGIFTSNPEIIQIAKYVVFVDIFLECARAVNMILVSALNASGDVKYPLFCSILVLWIISLPFSYLLAINFKLGLIGVWLAYAIDEILRSFLMIYRWKSGVWRKKSSQEHLEEIPEV